MSNVKEISLRSDADRPKPSSSRGTAAPASSFRDRLPSRQPDTTRETLSSSMKNAPLPSFHPPSYPPPAYQTYAPSQRSPLQHHHHHNDEKVQQSSHRQHDSRTSTAPQHTSPHVDQSRHLQSIPAKSRRTPSVVQPSIGQPLHDASTRQQSYTGASQAQRASYTASSNLHQSSPHNSTHRHSSQHNDSNQRSSTHKAPPSEAPRQPSSHDSSMKKPPIPETIPPPSQPAATAAPPTATSIFKTREDLHMASRQTKIESMRPHERKKQEEWAQTQIRRTGVCPEGYTWTRMPGGYRCNGKGHAMTDEILAEGRGGLFGLPTHDWNKREGPYYPSPNSPGKYYMVTKNENHGSTRPPERA